LNDWEPKFDSQHEQETFLFTKAYRVAQGPTQPPVQWVPGSGLQDIIAVGT